MFTDSCSGPDRTVSFCGGPDRSGSDLAVGHWAPIESVVNPDGPDKIVIIPIKKNTDLCVCVIRSIIASTIVLHIFSHY